MDKRLVEMVNLLLSKSSLEHEAESGVLLECVQDLIDAGHDPSQVELALDIAEELRDCGPSRQCWPAAAKSNRIFDMMETLHLPVDVRGMLHHLVNFGAITPEQREEIVERALMCEPDELSTDDIELFIQEYMTPDADQSRYLCVDSGAQQFH